MFKLFIMIIFHNSQKMIMNQLYAYFVMKITTWTLQMSRSIKKLVT